MPCANQEEASLHAIAETMAASQGEAAERLSGKDWTGLNSTVTTVPMYDHRGTTPSQVVTDD